MSGGTKSPPDLTKSSDSVNDRLTTPAKVEWRSVLPGCGRHFTSNPKVFFSSKLGIWSLVSYNVGGRFPRLGSHEVLHIINSELKKNTFEFNSAHQCRWLEASSDLQSTFVYSPMMFYTRRLNGCSSFHSSWNTKQWSLKYPDTKSHQLDIKRTGLAMFWG